MKTKLVLFTLLIIIAAACHTSKKSTTSTAESAPVVTATTPAVAATPTTAVVKPVKSTDGVYEPGEEELAAVQPQYKDATLAQLKEGYTLYAKSACISCHGTVNIYEYPSHKWVFVLPDMFYRAKLTPAQQDAVTKYVYAIMAANPNKR